MSTERSDQGPGRRTNGHDQQRRQDRYDRFLRWTEVPMLVLSLVLIPVVLMPVVEELSAGSLRALQLLGLFIWISFAVEYALMLALSPDRRHAVMTHKLDLLLVALPLLRPLRLARVLRLARAGTAVALAAAAVRRLLGRPGFSTVIGVVGGFVLVGGGLVAIAENGQAGSTIQDLGDGIWWAFVTCTTVGYGDTFPVTTTGRVIAAVLMLAGISGLSVVTANIAAYFVATDTEDEVDDLTDRLVLIEAQLDLLTDRILVAPPAPDAGRSGHPSDEPGGGRQG